MNDKRRLSKSMGAMAAEATAVGSMADINLEDAEDEDNNFSLKDCVERMMRARGCVFLSLLCSAQPGLCFWLLPSRRAFHPPPLSNSTSQIFVTRNRASDQIVDRESNSRRHIGRK